MAILLDPETQPGAGSQPLSLMPVQRLEAWQKFEEAN